ncbi:hypothetical protein BC628DRAFT_1423482 [Trametes gibbosa]|nr:hypothetical protein BC628DRAFT_1423482 [Trametes gibbosa]
MSTQQHTIAVILESLHVLNVDTSGARNLTRDATLNNVSAQGYAVRSRIDAAFTNLAGWINAISRTARMPFEGNLAVRVIGGFTSFVAAYSNLMAVLVEKHDVLTARNSPLDPGGAIIGELIGVFQFAVVVSPPSPHRRYDSPRPVLTRPSTLLAQVYAGWLRPVIPTHAVELTAQLKVTSEAYEHAAARYPYPDSARELKASELLGGKLNLPEAPANE